jgi:FeS assembly SUF system protein
MSDTEEGAARLPYDGDRTLREPIVAALKSTYDPEIPVDIYELGLIYGVAVAEDGVATVTMTLTSPACPAAESLPAEIKQKIEAIQGVESCRIELVWDPAWGQEMMSDVAKVTLGFY